MSDFSICQKLGEIMKITGERGALLTTKGKNYPNAMTIGWCTSGVMWGKPVIAVPVRQTRYSHECLDAHNEFSVFAPKDDSYSKIIAFCGTKSGRDMDKLGLLDLQTEDSKFVDAPCICGNGYVVHCRLLATAELTKDAMDEKNYERWYSSGESKDNMHTIYLAEVIDITENN